MTSSAIELEGFSKSFGSVDAVRDVSFRVDRGEAFGYLGPNGAGKTTTIRCLLGLVHPTAGSLKILGHDVSTHIGDALVEVGYLPGEFGLWPSMTGEDVLDYLGRLHPKPPAQRPSLCDRFELSRADLDRQVRFYSRGMKQKIGMVQAFQHAPELVVLDEPTEGLDPLMKERFIELLGEHSQRGGTAFLSSHILSEVELATDRVGILRAGTLIRIGPAAGLTGDRVRHCTLVLKQPVPLDAFAIPGVSDLRADGSTLRFDFRGEMRSLVQHIATLDVDDLIVEPEHLTEAFFDLFEGST